MKSNVILLCNDGLGGNVDHPELGPVFQCQDLAGVLHKLVSYRDRAW